MELIKPDVIFLDIDNTLYDYQSAHDKALMAAWQLAAKLIGISKSQFFSLYRDAKQVVKRRVGRQVASSHSRLLYFQHLVEQYGYQTQPQIILQLEQCYWHHFLYAAELFPGVVACLAEIKMQHIPIVAVTDLTAEIQFRKIVTFEIDQYIDFIVTSEEAGQEKPSAKPYLLALEKANLPLGSSVWMVGDNPIADIEGAKTVLSAFTIQKINSNQRGSRHALADRVINNFSELSLLLNQIQVGSKYAEVAHHG